MPVWRESRLRILRMHRIHGLGRRSFAQIGRNPLRRGRFQSLPQDWTEQGEVQSEVSSQRRTADIAGKRRNGRQPGTKEVLVCEKCSRTQVFLHSTGKGTRVPS